MGMRGGQLPVMQCVNVWKTLVRPVLEYGAVVMGDVIWPEAEQIQRRMGKMILRCSEKMTNEVVLGELGWWSMKGRRDMMRLLFWRKIVCMSQSRLVHLYSIGRAQHQAGKKSKWWKETHLLLQSLGLEHLRTQDGFRRNTSSGRQRSKKRSSRERKKLGG